jgi:hypothetical protein
VLTTFFNKYDQFLNWILNKFAPEYFNFTEKAFTLLCQLEELAIFSEEFSLLKLEFEKN